MCTLGDPKSPLKYSSAEKLVKIESKYIDQDESDWFKLDQLVQIGQIGSNWITKDQNEFDKLFGINRVKLVQIGKLVLDDESQF